MRAVTTMFRSIVSASGWVVMCGALAGMLGLAESGHGQCWDCESQYWAGDDCYIDSCFWTAGAGWSGCTQYGGCGDLETCDTYGHGCEGWALWLDGRYALTDIAALVEAMASEGPFQLATTLSWSREWDHQDLGLTCTDIVALLRYTPDETARPRTLTRPLRP